MLLPLLKKKLYNEYMLSWYFEDQIYLETLVIMLVVLKFVIFHNVSIEYPQKFLCSQGDVSLSEYYLQNCPVLRLKNRIVCP